MDGADTTTCCAAASVATKPAAVARTSELPAPVGSNAIPPAATDAGEADWPALIVTVAVCAGPVSVTSWPTALLLLVIVTVTAVPPTRTACTGETKVLGEVPAAIPT